MTETPYLRHAAGAIVSLRVISSFAWLNSALIGKDAKWAPSFLSGNGLAQRVSDTFVHTAMTHGISHWLSDVVLPHVQFFAISIAVADLAIGLSLLLGFLARLGGALAILRTASNILIAAGMGADTIGFNVMLILAGAIVIVTAAGRRQGVDAILVKNSPSSGFLNFLA